MNVETMKFETVYLDPTSKGKHTACGWVDVCPVSDNNVTLPCNICPAHGQPELLTREEAVKWWHEAKMYGE